MNITPPILAAFIAYSLLVIGLIKRKNTRIHAPLMLTGISMDIALLVILQIQRNAIQTALSNEMNIWQLGHIVSSLTAVVLYVPVVALGILRLKKISTTQFSRNAHIGLGLAAFLFRSIGFVLMFTMVPNVQN